MTNRKDFFEKDFVMKIIKENIDDEYDGGDIELTASDIDEILHEMNESHGCLGEYINFYIEELTSSAGEGSCDLEYTYFSNSIGKIIMYADAPYEATFETIDEIVDYFNNIENGIQDFENKLKAISK